MSEDIRQAGAQHVADLQEANQNMLEKGLRMRCLAYLAQAKSELLMETLHNMNQSRLVQQDTSDRLEQRNIALEHDRDLLELKVEERTKAYEKLAHYDTLTGLPNRFLFNDRVAHALARAEREGKKVGLLLIDLDRFKNINETSGHPVGDELLRQFGTRVQSCIRDQDTIARLGGDEFTVMLENFEHDRYLARVAEKIQQSLLKPFILSNQEVYVSVSIGISLYPHDSNDPVTLLKNADAAMYRAKEEGRNRYYFYTEELYTVASSRFSLENQLRQALECNQFEIHYQPQFYLESGELCGAEALVRWNHPERGQLPPSEFIWIAEETGLIVPIGELVLKTACKQAASWIKEDKFHGWISVNLSAIQFAQEDLVHMVKDALQASGLDPGTLELEITETALIGQPDRVSRIVDDIKSLGVSLSIDDFGTGYSSLAYLKRFRVDQLKIDRSFIRDIPKDHNDMAIVRAIIAMGEALGLTIVAEGVENQEQASFLAGVGCELVQGFLYGKPVPANEFQKKHH